MLPQDQHQDRGLEPLAKTLSQAPSPLSSLCLSASPAPPSALLPPAEE